MAVPASAFWRLAPAPMAGALTLVNEVYMMLSATETAVQSGNPPPPSDAVVPVRKSLDVITSDATLAAAEIWLAQQDAAERSRVLTRRLRPASPRSSARSSQRTTSPPPAR